MGEGRIALVRFDDDFETGEDAHEMVVYRGLLTPARAGLEATARRRHRYFYVYA